MGIRPEFECWLCRTIAVTKTFVELFPRIRYCANFDLFAVYWNYDIGQVTFSEAFSETFSFSVVKDNVLQL